MKTMYINRIKKYLVLSTATIFTLLVTVINQSCTNLDEELYDSVTPSNFFTTQEEFISALGAAYTRFADWATSDGTMALQETTTDEMVVPTRGQDWDDGG